LVQFTRCSRRTWGSPKPNYLRLCLRAVHSNPNDRRYTKTHEWIKVENGIGTIGITAHAAELLGDIVFVEAPDIGTEFVTGDSFGAVESVKAASDVYVPVSGTTVEVNEELENHPDLVNKSPWEKGWMTKIKIKNEEDLKPLLNNEEYKKLVEAGEL